MRRAADGRITVDLEGETVWFASDDAELIPAPEAAVAAFTLVAALQGRRLEGTSPVEPRLALGVQLLGVTVRGWWGCSVTAPRVRVGRAPGPRRDATGLLFTAGADSFHTLLRRRPAPDALIFVRGFDVDLDDVVRGDDTEARVRAVAAGRGLRAVVLRTNLRQVEAFRAVSWEQTHGGALAAVGHLLADEIGTLVVSSSGAHQADRPWGSHWRIDRRWSTRRLRVEQFGEDCLRGRKVAEIAEDPLVAEHLQVCWQLSGEAGNCGECPKCVLTMVMLDHAGVLDRYRFGGSGSVPERVGRLTPSGLFGLSLAPIAASSTDLGRAVRAYLDASPPAAPVAPRWRLVADRLHLP